MRAARFVLEFDDREPPRGTLTFVAPGARRATPFVGWLDLLRALAEGLARRGKTPDGGEGGER